MSIKVKVSTISLFIAIALGISSCSNQSDNNSVTSDNSTEETTVLRFSHFWPATSAMQTEVFEPWIKKLETESNGRLKVEIYPSATLSKPENTYDATAKGIVDIGSQAQGYTAGRFPLTQIAELPGLSNSAAQMSCMLQTLYENGTISSEYEDTHLLFMIGSSVGALHTVDKVIRTPEDMQGMRIRRPSAVASHIIEATGATAVGMPPTELYTSLQRGVIDGLSFAWSPAGDFRLTELTNAHTNIPFYTSSLLVTMNKDKYESLPDDLKKIIDDNSGRKMADMAADMFKREDAKFIEEARAKGDTIVDIPDPLNDPDWSGPLLEGSQNYLDEVSATGLDAQGVYEKAKAASAACKV